LSWISLPNLFLIIMGKRNFSVLGMFLFRVSGLGFIWGLFYHMIFFAAPVVLFCLVKLGGYYGW